MNKFVQKSIFIVAIFSLVGPFAQPALHKRKQREEDESQSITGEKPRKKLKVLASKKNKKRKREEKPRQEASHQSILFNDGTQLDPLAQEIYQSYLRDPEEEKEQKAFSPSDEKKQLSFVRTLTAITHETQTLDNKYPDHRHAENKQILPLDFDSDIKETEQLHETTNQLDLQLPSQEEITNTLSSITSLLALNDEGSIREYIEHALDSIEKSPEELNELLFDEKQPFFSALVDKPAKFILRALLYFLVINGCIFSLKMLITNILSLSAIAPNFLSSDLLPIALTSWWAIKILNNQGRGELLHTQGLNAKANTLTHLFVTETLDSDLVIGFIIGLTIFYLPHALWNLEGYPRAYSYYLYGVLLPIYSYLLALPLIYRCWNPNLSTARQKVIQDFKKNLKKIAHSIIRFVKQNQYLDDAENFIYRSPSFLNNHLVEAQVQTEELVTLFPDNRLLSPAQRMQKNQLIDMSQLLLAEQEHGEARRNLRKTRFNKNINQAYGKVRRLAWKSLQAIHKAFTACKRRVSA